MSFWRMPMRVAILGTGALGGVIAGCLTDVGADVVCVSRGRTAKILEDGLTIFTPEGTVEMIPGDHYVLIDSESGPLNESICKTCDVAIIAGKADSTSALSSIAEEIVSDQGFVVSIQNGLGNTGIIASRVGWGRVVGGSTTHSAWRDGEGGVHWTGRGSLAIGNMDGSDPRPSESEFVSLLDKAGLNPIWSSDINKEIWRKLMVNVAINPICAIAGIKNGALLEIPELWIQSLEAMREAESVARASGVEMGAIDIEDYLKKVVTATADNRVSMLQDIMAGRKTEIDVICGAVISKGEEFGVQTPRNEILLALVKGIEMSQNHD
jgi:2-dehydropantoate 2-reductase